MRRWFCLAALLSAVAMAGCGGSGKGACDGYSASDGYRWCVDSMTEAECTDFNARHVNSADWQLWSGQNCAERGCASGGPC